MSTGFSKWSNNDNSNLNVRAVRFGFSKPILETELNELQDLIYVSNLNTNRVANSPNTYTSNSGSRLFWEYTESTDTLVANLILDATSLDDIIKFVYSGGVEYFITPQRVGRQILTSLELPKNASAGTCITFISKAVIKTVSPDQSDPDFDESVSFATDIRYPSLTSTKRVIVESGFNGIYTDVLHEDYSSVYRRISETRINGLGCNAEVYLVLGSWKKSNNESNSESWGIIREIQKEIIGVIEPKYALLSDAVEVYGTYSLTPLDSEGTLELRLDFPIKSSRFGYYALLSKGDRETYAQPINHPLICPPSIFDREDITIGLYDLRDIVMDNKMWGDFGGQSWEDLLNQKWFDTNTMHTPSLILKLKEVSRLNGVIFGSLVIQR